MTISKYFTLSIFGIFFMFQFSLAQKTDVYQRPLQSERSHYYDAIHYKIQLKFDELKRTFWGKNTIKISPLKDDFSNCVLDAETFTVTSVTDKNGNLLKFEQSDHKLFVEFLKTYQYGDTVVFTVSYKSENVKADPTKFGMGKNYAIGLTFVDKTSDNPQIIQALSFPTGARHWFPCYDHPNDKVTQEIIVTVRENYQAMSNGKLLSVKEDKNNKTKTFHWFQDLSHPTYLSTLIAGPYMIIKDSLGSLPVNYWIYPKDKNNALRSFGKTPDIIEYFNREFGYRYPWAKYDQITIPGIGGGAECTSATLIGQSTIHDEKAEKDYPSHWLIAHEAAHQWWGDLVTLRDWGYTWINESFATYFEYIFAKHELGEDEGAINLLNKKNSYLNEAHNRYIRPIDFHHWDYADQNFDRHTYQKGAAVIHMMRWILGETSFKKTISHFLHKHAYKPVDTHDFLTAIKEVTGQNLDWFFNQWFLSPGHPVFDVSYDWDSGSKVLSVRIEQVQCTSKNIPIFKTPVFLGIVTKSGKIIKKVSLKNQLEVFRFNCNQKPLLVRFDEGNFLLKEWTFKNSKEELLYQLRNDDVIGRIWAATELGKYYEESTVLTALINSASNDEFWAVRRSAVNAIGKFEGNFVFEILKKEATDKNSKVRAAVFRVLGNYGQSDLVPFFMERFENENSYLTQSEIIQAIGKCGDKSMIKFLKTVEQMNSPRNVLTNAANRAIYEINKSD